MKHKTIAGTAVVCAFISTLTANSAELRRGPGETTIFHRTGQLQFDDPISIPISGTPSALLTLNLDRDGLADNFHDVLVLTEDGLHLLENRDNSSFVRLNPGQALHVGDLAAPAEGWEFARIRAVNSAEGHPAFLVTLTNDGRLRLFQISPTFPGSGVAASEPLLTQRESLAELEFDGPVSLETTRFEGHEVVAPLGAQAGVVAVRSRECPDPQWCLQPGELPDLSVIRRFDIFDWAQSATIADEDPLTFAAVGRRRLEIGQERVPAASFFRQSPETAGIDNVTAIDLSGFGPLSPVSTVALNRSRPDDSGALIVMAHQQGTNSLLIGKLGWRRVLDFGQPVTLSSSLSVPASPGFSAFLAAGNLGLSSDGSDDGDDDFIAVVNRREIGAQVHAFRDYNPPWGLLSHVPSDPITIESDGAPVRILDAAFGHFTADRVPDILLADAGGSRLILIPGRPPPEATFIAVSVHGHRGACSAVGELGYEPPIGIDCGPQAFPVDHVQELDEFSQDLLGAVDDINAQRRAVVDNETHPLSTVGFIGVNGHWEDSTTIGATSQIAARAFWGASMLTPAPTCFENMAALAVTGVDPGVFAPTPDLWPPDFWDAAVFLVLPSLYPVTSASHTCQVPLPNRGASARFTLAALGDLVEGWGVAGSRAGSAIAAANVAGAIEDAVDLARRDTVPCGQILVDLVGHSRGTPTISEALRVLDTTELGHNARVSMTFLDAIDRSFAPPGLGGCPSGDSCRPWAKAGFLGGDPLVEAVGNVDVSSGIASLPSQALPFQGLIEALTPWAGLPAGFLATHVVGLPIGHDRGVNLVSEAPAAKNRPAPTPRVFGQASPPTNHDQFQNNFFVGTNRAVLDPLESGFAPVSQLTMRNVSGLGRLLGVDPRAAIPDFDGWFRTLDEDVSGELGRMPAACGGTGAAAANPAESQSETYLYSPRGGHRQREFVTDPEFSESRGLVRNAKLLDQYPDVLKQSIPSELGPFVDAFLKPALRSTFPQVGAWKPKQTQTCIESREDSLPLIERIEVLTSTLLERRTLPSRLRKEVVLAQAQVKRVRSSMRSNEPKAAVQSAREMMARIPDIADACRESDEDTRRLVGRYRAFVARLDAGLRAELGRPGTWEANGTSNNPCILVLGSNEQKFAEALRSRMIEPRVGNLPQYPSDVDGCDGACRQPLQAQIGDKLAATLAAWSQELAGDPPSSQQFADRIQYISRLLSGGTHLGEAYARFLGAKSSLSQHLDPGSTLADSLLLDVEYQFIAADGWLEVSLQGAGMKYRQRRQANEESTDGRRRIMSRLTRSESADLVTLDHLTLVGRDVDLYRVSVRNRGPVRSRIDGHNYDLILLEGGVDWEHARTAAERMTLKDRDGALARVSDPRVLQDLAEQLEIDVPVWLGASGRGRKPTDFRWLDGSKVSDLPWAHDEVFDSSLPGDTYLYFELDGGKIQYRHTPQQTVIGGRPVGFLVDFGDSAKGTGIKPSRRLGADM